MGKLSGKPDLKCSIDIISYDHLAMLSSYMVVVRGVDDFLFKLYAPLTS